MLGWFFRIAAGQLALPEPEGRLCDLLAPAKLPGRNAAVRVPRKRLSPAGLQLQIPPLAVSHRTPPESRHRNPEGSTPVKMGLVERLPADRYHL
jgi:hypothetical protein